MAKKPAAKPNAKPNAADLLGNLTKQAGKAKPAAKKSDNPVVEVHGEIVQALETYTAASQGAKILDNAAKSERSTIEAQGLQRFIELWAENGTKPANPRLKTPAASCIFQVKQIKTPEGNIKEQLIQAGLSKAKAEKLAGFVTETTTTATKNLYDLLEGTDAEKEAAGKLLALIHEGLTNAEKELIFETKHAPAVDSDGIYAALAGEKEEVLQTVFGVLQPQIALGSLQHANVLAVAQELLAEAEEEVAHPNINVA